MRAIVLGAGGVGSVVAGFLARAGHEAVMLAREGHVQAVRNRGLHVKGLNDFRVSLPAYTEASGLEDVLEFDRRAVRLREVCPGHECFMFAFSNLALVFAARALDATGMRHGSRSRATDKAAKDLGESAAVPSVRSDL